MTFNKDFTFPINIDQMKIDKVSHCKFLGIMLDRNLKWADHINKVAKSLASVLYALRTVSQELNSRHISVQVYYALFESQLRYGLIFWGFAASGRLQHLFLLQKRAVRIICKANRLAHCKPLFQALKILTVYDLVIYECVTFLHGRYLGHRDQHMHDYCTRNRNGLVIPQSQLQLSKETIFHVGRVWYNAIPYNVRQISVTQFKTKVKQVLTASANYSFNECLENSIPRLFHLNTR